MVDLRVPRARDVTTGQVPIPLRREWVVHQSRSRALYRLDTIADQEKWHWHWIDTGSLRGLYTVVVPLVQSAGWPAVVVGAGPLIAGIVLDYRLEHFPSGMASWFQAQRRKSNYGYW